MKGLRTCLTLLLSAGFYAVAMAQGLVQQQVDPSAVQQNPSLKNVKVDQKPGAQVPLTATFKDESGQSITFGSLLKGRPVVLLPIFFRCTGVCNIELQGVLNALIKDPQLLPGRDLDVVALGIDPKEGPDLAKGKKASTLEEYGKPKSADGWHFLTGDLANIRAVTDSLGFSFDYNADKDQVSHPSGVMILTPKGQVSVYMLRGTYQPEAFMEDVARASKAKIAPKSEDIFFGCVHVDPLTGKRSLVIQNVLQLFGFVTVAGLALSIAVLSLRSRSSRLAS